jgi:hypothetical protein
MFPSVSSESPIHLNLFSLKIAVRFPANLRAAEAARRSG